MIYILLSAVLFTIILAYNSIMTIIHCAKSDKANNFENWQKNDKMADKYAENVKPSMYLCMALYFFYFIGEWVL